MAERDSGGRLEPGPHEIIDRGRTFEFDFEGRPVQACEGDTIASALSAAGVGILSRSFKYHRPRGLLCAAGRCPNCLLTVDGVPNVRGCTAAARAGMRVERQNAWPSADRDVGAVLNRMDRLLPVGFYYKAFYRPRALWELARPLVRRVAGLGSIDASADGGPRYRHRNLHMDVAIVGGGPAGMATALSATVAGADVALIDDGPLLGGHLLTDTRRYAGLPDLDDCAGHDVAAQLRERVRAEPRILLLDGASAFGLYQGNLLAIHRAQEAIKLRAANIILATGAFEVPMQFENNDLPGIMLTSAALRLARLYGVAPGERAVIATTDDSGYSSALSLLDAGITVAALVDVRPAAAGELADAVRARGVEIFDEQTILVAEGTNRVASVRVGVAGAGSGRRIECDLVCMSGRLQPATGLLLQRDGARVEFDESLGEAIPVAMPPGVTVAGDLTGIHDLRASLLQAALAGIEAAVTAGSAAPPRQSDLPAKLEALEAEYRAGQTAAVGPVGTRGKKNFVCFCEDVSVKDIDVAVTEGFGDIQTLKRYTTATMGPCQGKMCHMAFAEAAAIATGKSIAEIGATTSRPPAQPVPLGALAGPGHMPRKRTPLDRVHRWLGAQMVEAGPWLRPYSYGSPQDEVTAVRERAGLIDVSTLGKLDISGPDAGALLDRVYTHRFSNLRQGRIRYGLLCAENGSIMDDGTVTRLGEDHYFVTTTTGNVDAIEDWFNWWLAGTGMSVFVTNVTSAYGAINVAGPQARSTLAKLTDVDLSPDAFGYMRSALGRVAGVDCIFLRIGFVGETGWELHFPAEYAEHLWHAILEAGAEYGIAPFGLETQRILRLEKGHIIVNQDTDAVTNPLDARMRWAVRFDKPDFIGRAGIAAARDRQSGERLVGFVMSDGFVPEDGLPVVAGGMPVGRVTSSRFSPTLGRGFGLAWVPPSLATEGAEIRIRSGNNDWPATVTLEPVYDPKGTRLRQ